MKPKPKPEPLGGRGNPNDVPHRPLYHCPVCHTDSSSGSCPRGHR